MRAAGRFKGLGLVGGEAVPDSEDEGLHKARRARPDSAKACLQADRGPTLRARSIGAPRSMSRMSRGWAKSAAPLRSAGSLPRRRKGAARRGSSEPASISGPARTRTRRARRRRCSGIGELGRDARAREAQALDPERDRSGSRSWPASNPWKADPRPTRAKEADEPPEAAAAELADASLGAARPASSQATDGSRDEANGHGESLHAPKPRCARARASAKDRPKRGERRREREGRESERRRQGKSPGPCRRRRRRAGKSASARRNSRVTEDNARGGVALQSIDASRLEY